MTAIDYATPGQMQRVTSPEAPLMLAIGCALVPVAAGLGVTTLWLLTRTRGLEMFGFLVILGGLLLFPVGAIALMVFVHRCHHTRRPKWVRQALLAGFLLLVNFPLAGLCMNVAERTRIRVANASGVPIQSFVVIDPRGRQFEVGPIGVAQSTSRLLPLDGEGGVTFLAASGLPGTSPKVTNGTIDIYITGGMPGIEVTVTANPDGSFSVK